jgi:hypothetical protein
MTLCSAKGLKNTFSHISKTNQLGGISPQIKSSIYPLIFNNELNINQGMRSCNSCGKVSFYSINFLFSNVMCNQCFMLVSESKRLTQNAKLI